MRFYIIISRIIIATKTCREHCIFRHTVKNNSPNMTFVSYSSYVVYIVYTYNLCVYTFRSLIEILLF